MTTPTIQGVYRDPLPQSEEGSNARAAAFSAALQPLTDLRNEKRAAVGKAQTNLEAARARVAKFRRIAQTTREEVGASINAVADQTDDDAKIDSAINAVSGKITAAEAAESAAGRGVESAVATENHAQMELCWADEAWYRRSAELVKARKDAIYAAADAFVANVIAENGRSPIRIIREVDDGEELVLLSHAENCRQMAVKFAKRAKAPAQIG